MKRFLFIMSVVWVGFSFAQKTDSLKVVGFQIKPVLQVETTETSVSTHSESNTYTTSSQKLTYLPFSLAFGHTGAHLVIEKYAEKNSNPIELTLTKATEETAETLKISQYISGMCVFMNYWASTSNGMGAGTTYEDPRTYFDAEFGRADKCICKKPHAELVEAYAKYTNHGDLILKVNYCVNSF